ncbi:hypothetical protein K461DRAFT_283136 [Myriangium duriaei CBS 260.36]|uniref:Uncharacterized protein n=1 Tax=Myriangium duriaei CBS 260.36 TaxID=1168546 RepID=A0A9P4MBW6_9PEZI|nr:hypothetical protein K461DRAFT_283136 [Myriangium duriaei CBS 260.36]
MLFFKASLLATILAANILATKVQLIVRYMDSDEVMKKIRRSNVDVQRAKQLADWDGLWMNCFQATMLQHRVLRIWNPDPLPDAEKIDEYFQDMIKLLDDSR